MRFTDHKLTRDLNVPDISWDMDENKIFVDGIPLQANDEDAARRVFDVLVELKQDRADLEVWRRNVRDWLGRAP